MIKLLDAAEHLTSSDAEENIYSAITAEYSIYILLGSVLKEWVMPGEVLSIFISYSRTDSTFVDELEASLKSRNYRTWVDRAKLEGGQNWLDEIQKAIDRCDVLLVIVSTESVSSKYVLMEYRYALNNGKMVIPVFYEATKVPIDLNGIQYIDFLSSSETGLRDLLNTLSRVGIPELTPPPLPKPPLVPIGAAEPDFVVPESPPPALDPDLNDLYRAGMKAKSEQNLERAAVLWQQVLDRNPKFGNGLLAIQVNELNKELHPIHVQRLRRQAEEAHHAGKWGEEIGAWKALLALEDDVLAWERLPVAARNKQCSWLYENALHFATQKDYTSARVQLKELWQKAPYYGDPAGIARNVGVQVPPSIQSVLDAQTKAEVREAHSKARISFIEEDLEMDSFLVQFYFFCLISGLGSIAGIITHTLLWALVTIVFITLLAYIFGYIRAITLGRMSLIFVLSTGLALCITWLTSLLKYAQPQINQQFLFGAIISSLSLVGVVILSITGILEELLELLESMLLKGLTVLLGMLAILVITSFLGEQFAWGFGFGSNWYLFVIAWFVTCISEIGIFFSIKICYKAFW